MEQLSFFNKLLLLAYGTGVLTNCLILAAYYYCADDDDELMHQNVFQVLAMVLFVALSFIVWLIRHLKRNETTTRKEEVSDERVTLQQGTADSCCRA